MTAKPILWIVIPCYNEQEVLPITAPQFLQKVKDLAAAGLVSDKSRVCFVNDGSKDATWQLICSFARQDEHYIGISQSRNRGHQAAVLAGLMEARDNGVDVTISIDCDGQDDINAMDEMIRKYLAGAEVVYGVRSRRDTDTFFKRFTAEGFYHLMNLLGADIVFNHADYRLISSRVLDSFADYREVNIFLRGMVPWWALPAIPWPTSGTSGWPARATIPFPKCWRWPLTASPAFPTSPSGSSRHRDAVQHPQLHRGGVGLHRGDAGQHGGRLGQHRLHRLPDGRHPAGLPRGDRRIYRQDLYGDQGPAPLYHQRADLGPPTKGSTTDDETKLEGLGPFEPGAAGAGVLRRHGKSPTSSQWAGRAPSAPGRPWCPSACGPSGTATA